MQILTNRVIYFTLNVTQHFSCKNKNDLIINTYTIHNTLYHILHTHI